MSEGRGFSLRAVIVGAAAMLLLLLITGAAIVFGGLFPVAASNPHSAAVSWAVHRAMEQGVKRRASGLRPPQLSRADVLEGGSHFKGMCQQCHGGPGARPEQFATAMNPDPPELTHASREWSREEIFWIAKHGIKMTGMPAFGKVADDDELWKIAAFVDQLPNISASEYASLPDAHAHEGGSEGHSH